MLLLHAGRERLLQEIAARRVVVHLLALVEVPGLPDLARSVLAGFVEVEPVSVVEYVGSALGAPPEIQGNEWPGRPLPPQ